MCSIDTEQADVWVETPRTSRKAHACHGCGATIRPREAYNEVRWVADGCADTEKECFGCWWVARVFGKAHSIRPIPSNLWQDLQDCLERNQPTHLKQAEIPGVLLAADTYLRITPDAWADEIASIKRRYRTSSAGRKSLRDGWMRRAVRRELRMTHRHVYGTSFSA